MLLGGAAGLYPTLLPSIIDPSMDLTIYNSKTGEYGLRAGTIWWSIGMVLAIGYFVFLYRSVRGKVTEQHENGHVVPPSRRNAWKARFRLKAVLHAGFLVCWFLELCLVYRTVVFDLAERDHHLKHWIYLA